MKTPHHPTASQPIQPRESPTSGGGYLGRCDLVIVGAGSAGCTLAATLCQHFRVILVEPANATHDSTEIRRPSEYLRCFGGPHDWGLETTPQSQLHDRSFVFPRGRGWGGSTRINASIWLPPEPAVGKTIEDASDGMITQAAFAAAYQSVAADASPESPRWLAQSTRTVLSAARSNGLPWAPFPRMNRQGKRVTAADLLPTDFPAPTPHGARPQQTPGLQRISGEVTRLLLDGQRITGVQLNMEGPSSAGQNTRLHPRYGVILAAGAIHTPLLLQRSGIGPCEILEAAGVQTRIDHPNVGQQLQDHLVLPLIFQLAEPNSISNPKPIRHDPEPLLTLPTHWTPRQIARWQSIGRGPITSNIAEAGGFLGTGESKAQCFVTPTDYLRFPGAAPPNTMTLGVVLAHPRSRGSVTLTATHADSHVPPPNALQIDPAYLQDPRDISASRHALGNVLAWLQESQLKTAIARWTVPKQPRCDEAAWKRLTRVAQSLYHPVGTCRMATDDDAVLDGQFRLRGAANLWVCDASVLPEIPATNPNPVVMALARCAAQSIQNQLTALDHQP